MWTQAQFIAISKNVKVVTTVTSIVSFAAGASGAYFISKKNLRAYYLEISEREIAEAKEFYGRLHKSSEETSTPEKAFASLHGKKAAVALKSYQGLPKNREHPVETEEELFASPDVSDVLNPAQDENIGIVVNVFENATPYDNPDFNYEAEVALRTEDAPYIITQEEYLQNESDYDQTVLTYYESDDVVVDDRDQMLPDPDVTVGEAHLARFGDGSNDRNIIYIRNDHLEVEFEVQRSNRSYSEDVLGFIEHSERSGSRQREKHQRRRNTRDWGDDE